MTSFYLTYCNFGYCSMNMTSYFYFRIAFYIFRIIYPCKSFIFNTLF
uniref:Uncharacterized protein n=1 Tax=Siphoviridae sp. ctLqe90 TaxID=2825456 RepID=A0A8S5Q3T5_9CAUD|nr:MAG TPA: hypothetical protein [Siphoviridae sp. ctLqe90]DAG36093.1 MAG TPA: hypothetical protein [Caudoviricetes sp.]